MINLEFSSYTLSVFIIHIVFASITFLYGLRFSFLLKSQKEKPLLANLVAMSFCSFALILIMAIGVLDGLNKTYGLHAYIISWFFGLGTYYFYLSVMRNFYNLKDKKYFLLERVYLGALSFYLVDMLYFLIVGDSFLNETASGRRSLFFVEMNYTWSPNLLGKILSTICGVSFFTNAISILKHVHGLGRGEILVRIGVLLSLFGLLNDSILGSGIFYYGFPLSFLGCIFEITRISNHFTIEAQAKLTSLQGEFSKISRAAHLGLTHGRTMHDTNNNLTNISFSAMIIKKLYEKDNLTIEKLNKNIDSILSNVDTIVKVSRKHQQLLHKDQSGEVGKCNIESCINKTIQDLGNTLDKCKIQYNVSLSTKLELEVDETELYICLTNLINNSVDAVRRLDSKSIWIDDNFNDDIYKIFIHDSGNGIPVAIQNKIFETQFTTKKLSEGTGLGLSTVKELLMKNGGSIYVDNSFDHTCFVLEFPVR